LTTVSSDPEAMPMPDTYDRSLGNSATQLDNGEDYNYFV
jgi:hypothetical protein